MITEPADDEVVARRRRVALFVGGALLLVVVAIIVGSLLRTPDVNPPPDSGLLSWMPRGALVGDEQLIDAAEAVWRDAGNSVVPSEEDVYLLFADEIGAGRVVLMQAIGSDGRPYVAQASEQGDPAVLGLDAVEVIPDDHLVALAVTYDGNLHIEGLEAGRGSALIQLLPEPPESSDTTGLWRFETSFAHTGLERLETKPNGITETFLQLDKSDPAGTPVVISTTFGANAGVARTIAVRGGRLVPADSRISLADDLDWGPSGRILGDEYTALSLAATKLEMGDATGFVAASVPVDEFGGLGVLATLVVLRAPDGPERIACVVTDGGDLDVIPDAVLADPMEVALDQAQVLAGSCPVTLGSDQRIAAVAVARPDAGEVVLEDGGRVIAGPAESVVAVLDEGASGVDLVARLDGADGAGSSYPLAVVTP